MKRKLIAVLMAAAMATTMAMPVLATETETGSETEALQKAATEAAEGTGEATNNVNDPNYQYPDYSGETISFMWWGSDTRHQKTIEVIEKYEELTGLKIEYEYSDGTSYWTQFQAKMAGGELRMYSRWETTGLPIMIPSSR